MLGRALVVAVVLVSGAAWASPQAADLVAQGDAFDSKLENQRALELYLRAEKLGAADAETLYRIARQYALSMNDELSRDRQRELGEKALAYAKRAIAANPDHAKSQLSAAICYGRLVSFVPSRTRVEYSRLIKEHAEKALALDPSDSYAWHVLGAWNYELAQMGTLTRAVVKVVYGGMPAASNEEAARLYRKAVELAPQRVSHHVELGRTYAALGRNAEAREQLEKALALPDREKDDPESKRRARQALATF